MQIVFVNSNANKFCPVDITDFCPVEKIISNIPFSCPKEY